MKHIYLCVFICLTLICTSLPSFAEEGDDPDYTLSECLDDQGVTRESTREEKLAAFKECKNTLDLLGYFRRGEIIREVLDRIIYLRNRVKTNRAEYNACMAEHGVEKPRDHREVENSIDLIKECMDAAGIDIIDIELLDAMAPIEIFDALYAE